MENITNKCSRVWILHSKELQQQGYESAVLMDEVHQVIKYFVAVQYTKSDEPEDQIPRNRQDRPKYLAICLQFLQPVRKGTVLSYFNPEFLFEWISTKLVKELTEDDPWFIGPYANIDPDTYISSGHPTITGYKQLQNAYEMAEEGNLDAISGSVKLRFWNNIQGIGQYTKNQALLQEIDQELKSNPFPGFDIKQMGLWIYGEAGCGKSGWVARRFPRNIMYRKNPQNKWWDYYQGEQWVLLEDVDPSNWAYVAQGIKYWGDIFHIFGETKGGTTIIKLQGLIVTSNYTIQQLCSKYNDPDMTEAIKRRFKEFKFPSFKPSPFMLRSKQRKSQNLAHPRDQNRGTFHLDKRKKNPRQMISTHNRMTIDRQYARHMVTKVTNKLGADVPVRWDKYFTPSPTPSAKKHPLFSISPGSETTPVNHDSWIKDMENAAKLYKNPNKGQIAHKPFQFHTEITQKVITTVKQGIVYGDNWGYFGDTFEETRAKTYTKYIAQYYDEGDSFIGANSYPSSFLLRHPNTILPTSNGICDQCQQSIPDVALINQICQKCREILELQCSPIGLMLSNHSFNNQHIQLRLKIY